jgi:hypothetical protein
VKHAAELVCLLSAGLFAGGALYVSVAEHPARVAAGTDLALAQFPLSYTRAAPLQGGSATLSLIFGIVAAATGGTWAWALAGGCVGAAVPLTLVVIEPVNEQLRRQGEDLDGEAVAAALLSKWARLHALRTALSLAGFALAGALALYS